MADEPTVYADSVNLTDQLDSGIAEYLRENLVLMPLVHQVQFTRGSDSVKLRQKGTVAATTAAEATAHAMDDYEQSTPGTLQVQEVKVYIEHSYKAQKFGMTTTEELIDAMGYAVMKKVETDLIALADGFATEVGSTTVDLTPEVLRTSFYNLDLSNVPGPYASVLHATQISDVQQDLLAAAADVWGNPNVNLSILGGQPPQINGLKGVFLDVPIFRSNLTKSINGGDDWAGLTANPQMALAFATDDRGIVTEIDRNIEKGVLQLAAYMFYDTGEYIDLAGVQVTSDQ